MTQALASRSTIQTAALAAMSVLLGLLAARHSNYAVAVAALGVVVLLAFLMPVAHATVLIALTTIVPYSVADTYHLGGSGTGGGGIQISDVFLLTGLLRAGMLLPHLRLTRRQLTIVALVVLSCLWTLFEGYRGLRAGQGLPEVGAEFRALGGGFAFALIAIALLADRGAHRRMLRALILLGLGLGVFGIAQWIFGYGVRAGVDLTTSGTGQLQGGLYAFPVVVVIAAAVLASGTLKSWRQRGPVVAVLVLNAVSLLLTFERTFWVAAVLAVLFVVARAGRRRRARALLTLVIATAVGVSALAAISPTTLVTAEQRLTSIGQFTTDNSVRYRNVESAFVLAKIRAKPLAGWGLGDTIFWAQPWEHNGPPIEQSYTHVGYLWMLWREGFLGSALLLALLALSAIWPGRLRLGGAATAVKSGCQGAVVALAIANFTFPAFQQGSQITYVMGFLIAYCALPAIPRRVLARNETTAPSATPRALPA
jgi:O-Antigen ligase